jgi:UDP-2-acetamido-2-deoxy-ribo-hexuluronate aminotransferase
METQLNKTLPIQMVDLKTQYLKIKSEIDAAIAVCFEKGDFIGGSYVQSLQKNLSHYLHVRNTIGCANGTDALQIAMMALGLKAGDEVIVPTFTYVATAEVIGLLGLTPVMVDVDLQTFNVRAEDIERAITDKTRAIVPVHLFGQCCDMQPIINVAKKYHLYIIEDNAQAIGAVYTHNGEKNYAGTIGHIGCTSFYPSKNLGAYGDGGAIFTNDDNLAAKLKTVANHGQSRRYYHDCIGVNSRLDNLQAAFLDIKLKYLDDYIAARQQAAAYYDEYLAAVEEIICPHRAEYSSHVFHQYTIRVPAEKRDELQQYLQTKQIPAMIYYPLPLYEQDAFKDIIRKGADSFPNTDLLCASVISLPMHSELTTPQLEYICAAIKDFFSK